MLRDNVSTIADVDRKLAEWVSKAVPSESVFFSLQPESPEDCGVSLYLLSIEQSPATQGRRPTAQLALRYLVTVWSNDPLEAHQILGELAFSAMEQPLLEVECAPLPVELWAALQMRPQPAIVVRTQLARMRMLPALPEVRIGLQTRRASLGPMTGVIMGPNSIPIPYATVKISSLNLSTRSDAEGRFRFPSLPLDLRPTFNVEAKGRRVTVSAPGTVGSREPLVIQLDESES